MFLFFFFLFYISPQFSKQIKGHNNLGVDRPNNTNPNLMIRFSVEISSYICNSQFSHYSGAVPALCNSRHKIEVNIWTFSRNFFHHFPRGRYREEAQPRICGWNPVIALLEPSGLEINTLGPFVRQRPVPLPLSSLFPSDPEEFQPTFCIPKPQACLPSQGWKNKNKNEKWEGLIMKILQSSINGISSKIQNDNASNLFGTSKVQFSKEWFRWLRAIFKFKEITA